MDNQLRNIVAKESVQSCGLGQSLWTKWTFKLVFEAAPRIPIENEVGMIERAEEISPASVGLTIAEGKALLASLQEKIAVTGGIEFSRKNTNERIFCPRRRSLALRNRGKVTAAATTINKEEGNPERK